MRHPAPGRSIALALAALALWVPAGAVGFGPPEARSAVKSKRCRSVRTINGGKARFVVSIAASCRTARRVARRADGARYRALGFRCKPKKKRVPGRVYGCGRLKKGRAQGVGFVYTRP
jgi:hypothetical protein